MSHFDIVKLSEVIKQRKGSIIIDNDKEYKLCRVQLHRRGVVLRGKQFGYQIKTKKQQICHAGDLIVAEMDAKFGGYGFIPSELEGAIVSSHYYLYSLDKSKITQEYLQTLIKTDYIQNQIEAKGSTNYSSIRAWEFLDYKIPLPSLERQHEISLNYIRHDNFKESFIRENDYQSSYLSLLRQAILQEAIEGKLTEAWRKKNPVKPGDPDYDAASLLEKIKAEKQKLIAEGNPSTGLRARIKKEKPLVPIKPEEVPFQVPEGWVWCRLGEVCFKITDGFHNTPKKLLKGIPYIAATHVKSDKIDWEQCHYVSEKDHKELFTKTYPQKGEILLVNIGAGCGTPAIIDVDFEFSFKNTAILKFNQSHISNKYIFNYFILKRNEIYSELTKGGLQPFLSLSILNNIIIPLPPLDEQYAVVERVERLVAMVNELEMQVAERKERAEELMQAVLREAFEA